MPYAAKEFVEYDNPFDVGMTGLLGFFLRLSRDDELRHALDAWKPTSPISSFTRKTQPSSKSTFGENRIGRRTKVDLGLIGDVKKHVDRAHPQTSGEEQCHSLESFRSRHYARPARVWTIWPSANPAEKPNPSAICCQMLDELAGKDAIFYLR